MKHTIVLLPGDGIGPEVVASAVSVLQAAADKPGMDLVMQTALIGGAAIDATGAPLPQQTVEACRNADAVLLGAVGGPKWDSLSGGQRPESGLLGIRAALGLYANLRPAVVYRALREASPLKLSILGGGLDILVVRELTGGIYFGKRGRVKDELGNEAAYDTEQYSIPEIRRIAKTAFEAAQRRKGRLVSVDKANVMESSRLWREQVTAMGAEYPQVQLSHMYVDNAAMQLVRAPGQFDVMLTSNLFGDILSDEASMITGSIGMLPSASLGDGSLGLYEPIHGSAPDIAGKDVANPLATILSAAMMLRYSLGEPEVADIIEQAVQNVLEAGCRTADLVGDGEPLGTKAMADRVVEAVIKTRLV